MVSVNITRRTRGIDQNVAFLVCDRVSLGTIAYQYGVMTASFDLNFSNIILYAFSCEINSMYIFKFNKSIFYEVSCLLRSRYAVVIKLLKKEYYLEEYIMKREQF